LQASDFKYIDFRGCYIPYAEMKHALPTAPNLRQDLAAVLAREAGAMGATADARRYRLEALKARDAHLLAGIKADSEWYRDHFTDLARVLAAGRLLASKANGTLWGHGERIWVLLRNLVLLGFVVYPILFFLVRSKIHKPSGAPLSLGDYIYLSLINLIPGRDYLALTLGGTARLIALTEVIVGFVFTGLLVAMLLRWTLRR
jgi:hypothetical protein